MVYHTNRMFALCARVPRFSSLSGRLSFYDKAYLNPPCLHGGFFMCARIVTAKPRVPVISGRFEKPHPFG